MEFNNSNGQSIQTLFEKAISDILKILETTTKDVGEISTLYEEGTINKNAFAAILGLQNIKTETEKQSGLVKDCFNEN